MPVPSNTQLIEMGKPTEYDYDRFVKAIAQKHGLTESQEQYVNMYCAENGYDCGADCWQVAMDTLEMVIDQGQLMQVANNEL